MNDTQSRVTNRRAYAENFDVIFRGTGPADTIIPPMTDPLCAHWEQPALERILLSPREASMTFADFERLAEYSASIPTGTYLGKMWRSRRRNEWFLHWYDVDPDPKMLAIPSRRIVIRCSVSYCRNPAVWQEALRHKPIPNGRKLCAGCALIYGSPKTLLPFEL